MAIQTANLGTAPSGIGGDTFRTAATKFNENFSNNEHAASRLVGTQAGNVMEVGAFGWGADPSFFYESSNPAKYANRDITSSTRMYYFSEENKVNYGVGLGWGTLNNESHFLIGGQFTGLLYHVFCEDMTVDPTNRVIKYNKIYTTGNATVDANGFLKGASPIVKLFADRIELNDDAKKQNITFHRLNTGEYLVKGSLGFAQDGWYIETPKDANGNLLVAVVYEQLANGDISVKTYDYMLNKKGRIVADTETPLDIPENRWIDLRLQEMPEPELVLPESNTPASFQPTGIAQAVSEMMNGTEQ